MKLPILALLLSAGAVFGQASPQLGETTSNAYTVIPDHTGQYAPALLAYDDAETLLLESNTVPSSFAPLEGGTDAAQMCWTSDCKPVCVTVFARPGETEGAHARRFARNVRAFQLIFPPDPPGSCP